MHYITNQSARKTIIMGQYKKRVADILFLDIETAGMVKSFTDLSQAMQELWQVKARLISRNKELSSEEGAELFSQRAGIYSEFARVVCISVGFFEYSKGKQKTFRTKSFYGDERKILKSFIQLVKAHFDKPKKQAISGHNIREFDIPFLCRRMVIHALKVPKMLDLKGKKPWQVPQLLDTLELWRFGDYKNYTSLKLLATVLGVPSPKEDIDGSMVHSTYWDEKDIKRICEYCERDVVTSAKVFLRIHNMDLPKDLKLVSKTDWV